MNRILILTSGLIIRRFLHTTMLGSIITKFFWNTMTETAVHTMILSRDPIRFLIEPSQIVQSFRDPARLTFASVALSLLECEDKR